MIILNYSKDGQLVNCQLFNAVFVKNKKGLNAGLLSILRGAKLLKRHAVHKL